ncbi:MAG TPA: MBL fold metallo-hydrolase [Thermoanaerobaculia bacterium]|nr:MBL fold metallo-hydrolase [Thermoanaerobaculia bacterium]
MTAPGLSRAPVAERVEVFTLGGDSILTSFGANALAVYGHGAVLVVDPFVAPDHARLLEAALQERTSDPVRFVILTHHHTDHALGAAYFARKGAVVAAHRRCAERMAAEHPALIAERRARPELAGLFADASSLAPAALFDERLDFDLRGISVRVRHAGHAHTPGDAVLLIGDDVVVTGDIVSNGYHVNYEDASPEGAATAARALLEGPGRLFVPGHGAPGGREIVERQIAYHVAVRGAARRPNAAAEIHRLFPGYLLGTTVEASVARLCASG